LCKLLNSLFDERKNNYRSRWFYLFN
jgi:hypothetical protein